MIPLLIAAEFLVIMVAVRIAQSMGRLSRQEALSIYALLAILAAWLAVTIGLAVSGTYMTAEFLEAYPTFWLPFIPIVLIVFPLAIFRPARNAVRNLIDTTPLHWLTGFHALRILAVGSLVKAWRGEFPLSFAIWVGIPDLLFGLSAIAVTWLTLQKRMGPKGLVFWNILGVLVIVPGAPIVAQMGLPGVMHRIDEFPSVVALYEFPMVLAPSFVVPVFVMLNVLVAWRLVERSTEIQQPC